MHLYVYPESREKQNHTAEAEMAPRPSASKQKPCTLSLLVLSLSFILLIHTIYFRPKPVQNRIPVDPPKGTLRLALPMPRWYNILRNVLTKEDLKIGFVNTGEHDNDICGLSENNIVTIKFDRVSNDTKWEDLFPEWVDEDEKWKPMSCPEIPMPRFKDYGGLDVVVARVPEGVRDVFRLQVNLVVANMLVRSAEDGSDGNRTVYVVFVGSSGPMWEIFRCDDMLWHEGEYRIYRPDMRRLKQKVAMPVGSCQIAPPFSPDSGQLFGSVSKTGFHVPREAYVTVLHSSEIYVCGAIALAQSIIRTNSTKDLVLLADDSISTKSLKGFESAGWKVKRIERIRSPHAKAGAYNEYNYSKLRIWQLIEYDKVMFIDADLIVLKDIDQFFSFPQLTAAGNDKYMFNSGVMLVEPSTCMFNALMEKRFTLDSYNGGDQGFLNEAFTWWHRWHSKLNHLKIFQMEGNRGHDIPENLHTIHYLGLKPWMCYRDYDCNWDMSHFHPFASDSAHREWWHVYDAMPSKLKPHCGLTKRMEARIRKWREIARNASFPNGHWKIKVKDGRSLYSA